MIPILPFLNNPKDLDPSCKTDLDLSDCFGRRKKLRLITKKYGISKLMDGAFWLYNDFLDGEQKLFLKIIVICYFSQ